MIGVLALSDRDLQDLSAAIRSGRIQPPYKEMAIQRIVANGPASQIATELQGLQELGFTALQIDRVIQMLLADRCSHRADDETVDIVTTGPGDHIAGNRDTSVVVRDLFTNASESVLVAGYAVYQGQRVFQALANRMQEHPELRARLFLDIQRGHGDTSAADELVSRFAHRFRESEWPKDRPLPEVYFDPRSLDLGPHRTSLHAKCVVVDGRKVFISSANFTEAAQLRNIEVGVTIDSEAIGKRVTEFFDSMLASGALVRVRMG